MKVSLLGTIHHFSGALHYIDIEAILIKKFNTTNVACVTASSCKNEEIFCKEQAYRELILQMFYKQQFGQNEYICCADLCLHLD